MTPSPRNATHPSYRAEDVKRAAAGRWLELLVAAGVPTDHLDFRHHPCPKCGGKDRFRLLDAEAGAVFCNQCFATGNGDGLAAVKWLLSLDFPEALAWTAERLRLASGRNGAAAQAVDVVEAVAKAKGVEATSLRLYGAAAAKRGKAEVCRLPMFDSAGHRTGNYDIGTSGDLAKGKTAKGATLGLFLPQGDDGPRLPKTGEVWAIVEGAKDAAALHELGILALGLPGATPGKQVWKWLGELLQNAEAVIVPDLDDAGDRCAEDAACHLEGLAASVRVARLPGRMGSGDDVRDVRRRLGADAVLQAIERARPAREAVAEPVLRRLSDVESKPVQWLWEGRLALGKLTLLAGDPGLGKSFLSLDVAARVSRGDVWPDGRGQAPAGEVLLLSAEDDAEDTIKPRLEAACAECGKIVILDGLQIGNRKRQVTLAHLSVIEAALDQVPDCRLLIVDPISAFCGDSDSHKNAEVRALLAPLSELAARRGLAVLAVTHLRKGDGAAIYRAMGSLAFTAAARAVWAVSKNP